jgi:polyribonucleotide nucleotidyltransferase
MKVQSDCVIRIAASSAVCKVKAEAFKTELGEVRKLSPSSVGFSVKVAPDAALKFLPGQYMNVTVPGTTQTRSYSFSSMPKDGVVDFLVRNIPGGQMSTYLSQNAKPGIDFLPLTVDYIEKAYAAGKIPGGYFKREGRPAEKEVLTSRLIDRPLRPLFPEGYYFETQVIASVLSADKTGSTDVVGITAASAALSISNIPFQGPVAGVKIGRVKGQFVVNPDLETLETSDLHLVVAGTADAIMMVEAGANELPEATMLEALALAHAEIKKIVAKISELAKLVGSKKREVKVEAIDPALAAKVKAMVAQPIRDAIMIPNKAARQERLDQVMAEAVEKLKNPDVPTTERHVKMSFTD